MVNSEGDSESSDSSDLYVSGEDCGASPKRGSQGGRIKRGPLKLQKVLGCKQFAPKNEAEYEKLVEGLEDKARAAGITFEHLPLLISFVGDEEVREAYVELSRDVCRDWTVFVDALALLLFPHSHWVRELEKELLSPPEDCPGSCRMGQEEGKALLDSPGA
eukprot:GHVN01024062.1.p1 GENE.GHVN01024062.1~~GHVN01024062.1.p1  ORF type:complete len:161 (+),score=36.58 GHVN01024062.1:8-490(+)